MLLVNFLLRKKDRGKTHDYVNIVYCFIRKNETDYLVTDQTHIFHSQVKST